jgi:ferritin-like protein
MPEKKTVGRELFTNLRVNLIGLEGDGLKQIAEDARIEDRNHFEALVPRIYELGGKLPGDMVEFHNISACPPAKLPANPRDINAMLGSCPRLAQVPLSF